ncbi:amino acid adenylation domain-containing protein [Ascidiimonas aurantiaca]|uniref:non-ribosomal peptide synthetase n=1 Tax=Ascidiimonas aurantiaca TaxID=1685432 RepID=UPI0030EE03DF
MKLEDVYPLSPLQQGMYYHWLTDPTAYFEQMSYRIQGTVNIAKMKESYDILVARHSVLRTFFTHKLSEDLLQVVKKEVPSTFSFVDALDKPGFSLETFKEEDRARGFDLHKDSQMRLYVIHLGEDQYELVWSMHHILMDGWCLSLLMNEFFQIYESLLKNEEPHFKKPYRYSDYIKWLMKKETKVSESYWKEYLEEYDTAAIVPGTYHNKVQWHGETQKAEFVLEGETRKGITTLCNKLGITENTFIQTVWGVLLSRYTNTNDVVFGSVVSGRPAEIPGIEEMIGLFINTVPVRIQYSEKTRFLELLQKVHQEGVDSTAHHYMGLSDIQSQSSLGRDLFNHVVVFENFPVEEMVRSGLENDQLEADFKLLSSEVHERTNYPLNIIIVPGERLCIRIEYDVSTYHTEFIEYIKTGLINVINVVINNPDIYVTDIEIINDNEKKKLLLDFNNSYKPVVSEKVFPDMFSEQVYKTPEETALIFDNIEYTYLELNKLVNQLANFLKEEYNVGAEDLVTIVLPRSEWMVVAILAISKTGAAFVPVDMKYPKERQEFIIEDSSCKVVFNEEVLSLFKEKKQSLDTYFDVIKIIPSQLAYVIYTSGSTGTPKGVLIEHKNLSSFFHSCSHIIEEKDIVMPVLSSVAFDIFLFECFFPLLRGGTSIICSDEIIRDVGKLASVLKNVTVVHAVPVLMQELLDSIKNTKDGSSYKHLIKVFVGGDKVPNSLLKDIHSVFPKVHIQELYGPTEATIFSCSYYYSGNVNMHDYNGSLIGKPNTDTRVLILNEHLKLCPVGVIGEICLEGPGIARGYLNMPELTNQHFVENPYDKGNKIYKTGDLGCWLSNGVLKIVGRNDNQVKIRGYRIELGEIEEAIRSYPAVTNAVVLAKSMNGDNKELIAYLVKKSDFNMKDLRAYLLERLPFFMLPGTFVELSEFPVTSRGKIDRTKLPLPDKLNTIISSEYRAPQTKTEKQLQTMWEQILEKEKIGILDNFFDLGGHSIKATKLKAQIFKVFGVELDLPSLLEDPTIANISEEIEKALWVNKEELEKDQVDRFIV